jgi:hypothetical protein
VGQAEEELAKFEETACLRARLGKATLKGKHLPSRDREGAGSIPDFASASEVCPTLAIYPAKSQARY